MVVAVVMEAVVAMEVEVVVEVVAVEAAAVAGQAATLHLSEAAVNGELDIVAKHCKAFQVRGLQGFRPKMKHHRLHGLLDTGTVLEQTQRNRASSMS